MRGVVQRLGSTLIALAGVFAITFICARLHASATVAGISLCLGVLLAGAYGHTTEAIFGSLAAAFCLVYFFVPPTASRSIHNPEGWIALIVFLAIALFEANLAARRRKQRDHLVSQHEQAERLYALNRAMLLAEGGDIRRLIVNKCIELFGFQEVALFERSTGLISRSGATNFLPEEALRRVAREGSPDRNSVPSCVIVPITLGNKMFGSVGFCGEPLPERSLQALGNTIAIGLAQAQAQEAGSRAEAVRKSEELKSIMIDALAHDLKTPLTAIEAASDMLLHTSQMRLEQREDLLEVIRQEAQGLRQLVNEAIHLARIDADRLKLERQPMAVRALVETAIQSLGARAASHKLEIEIPNEIPLVWADGELISQALKQVLDNAIKYSPSASRVAIKAEEANGFVRISIRDQGPGLTEVEQSRVFDKFYRGHRDRFAVQGTGMGLAITKEILEAHGGTASVESQVGQGSKFTVSLPIARLPVETAPQIA